MQYLILEGGTKKELASTVQQYLNAGWKPQGGVATLTYETWFQYCQAVVKE